MFIHNPNNTRLRYSQTTANVKNLYQQLLNIRSSIKLNRQVNPNSLKFQHQNRQNLFRVRSEDSIVEKTLPVNIKDTRCNSEQIKSNDVCNKINLQKQKQFEKTIKNEGNQNNFRSSTASQVIFKYSEDVRANRKDSLKKIKSGVDTFNNFRKTFNTSQKLRTQKVDQKCSGLNNLQNTLNYLESRVNKVRNHLFKKNEKKLNSSNYNYSIQKNRQQFIRQNTKESQISTNTVKKTSHLRIFSVIADQTKAKQNPFFQKNSPSNNQFYYISQAIRAINEKNSMVVQHIYSSIRILKYLQNEQLISADQIEAKKIYLKKQQKFRNKKTIIFDLDQTLIHCNQNTQMKCDVKLPLPFGQSQIYFANINIRPHALIMLNQLVKNFEIIVFTASQSSYANVVLDYLDPEKKLFHHRLFRQNCIETGKGMYIKDLRILNRNLSDIVIVDNSAYSYFYQLENGIPIIPYYEGTIDIELKMLTKYLNDLINVKDVREVNRKFFKLHHYTKFTNPSQLIQQLYMN